MKYFSDPSFKKKDDCYTVCRISICETKKFAKTLLLLKPLKDHRH